jgi:hypothetical protein
MLGLVLGLIEGMVNGGLAIGPNTLPSSSVGRRSQVMLEK